MGKADIRSSSSLILSSDFGKSFKQISESLIFWSSYEPEALKYSFAALTTKSENAEKY